MSERLDGRTIALRRTVFAADTSSIYSYMRFVGTPVTVRASFVEACDLRQLVCPLQPGDSVGPKRVAQAFAGLPRIGVRIDAGAADSDQVRQRVQIDGQW